MEKIGRLLRRKLLQLRQPRFSRVSYSRREERWDPLGFCYYSDHIGNCRRTSNLPWIRHPNNSCSLLSFPSNKNSSADGRNLTRHSDRHSHLYRDIGLQPFDRNNWQMLSQTLSYRLHSSNSEAALS